MFTSKRTINVAKHGLIMLVSEFLSHQPILISLCVSFVKVPCTTGDTQMKALKGQLKFSFSEITAIIIFQQVSVKCCYCFKVILF